MNATTSFDNGRGQYKVTAQEIVAWDKRVPFEDIQFVAPRVSHDWKMVGGMGIIGLALLVYAPGWWAFAGFLLMIGAPAFYFYMADYTFIAGLISGEMVALPINSKKNFLGMAPVIQYHVERVKAARERESESAPQI